MGISRYNPLLIGAAALPALFLFLFQDPFTTPKFAAAALLTAAAILLGLARGRLSDFSSDLDMPILAFAGAFVLSAVFSKDSWPSWRGADDALLVSAPGAALCVAGFYAVRAASAADESFPERLALYSTAGAVLPIAFALLEPFGFKTTPAARGDASRVVSSFGHPTFLAAYLVMIAPVAFHQFLDGGKKRVFGGVVFFGALLALVLSGARGGLFVFPGLLLFIWLRRPWAVPGRIVFLGLGLAALLGALSLSGKSGDSERVGAWGIGLREFASSPWTGSGPGTFSLVYRARMDESIAQLSRGTISFPHAHNDWIEAASSLGGIGLAAFAWLHWGAARSFASSIRGAEERIRSRRAAFASGVAALALYSKANLPDLTTVWLASAWVGAAALPISSSRFPARAAAALALACALFSVGISCIGAAADRAALLGRQARFAGFPREALQRFEKAAALNPGRLSYRWDLMNALWDVAQELPSDGKTAVLGRAFNFAAAGVLLRPQESEMHRMLGLNELRRAQLEGRQSLPTARAALEASVLKAPWLRFGVADLKTVAELQGDLPRARELGERLDGMNGGSKHGA